MKHYCVHTDFQMKMIINNWSQVIAKTREMVRGVMSQYDGSHDFHHVERVVKMAKFIAHKELALPTSDVSTLSPSILEKLQVIELAAYLHDVNDHKYVQPNQHGQNKAQRAIEEHLSQLLVPENIIDRVQYVVDNISFSKEVKRMQENKEYVDELPIELKIVCFFLILLKLIRCEYLIFQNVNSKP